MRNCDFYRFEEVAKMHSKYRDVLAIYAAEHPNDKYIHNVPTVVEWLYKEADTALQFDIGQVLQMTQNDHQSKLAFRYVIVKKFMTGNYCSAPGGGKSFLTFNKAKFTNMDKSDFVLSSSLEHHVLPASATLVDIGTEFRLKLPDIPQELMALFAPKCGIDWGLEPLKEKCPFKDDWKTPVPPCMKKEEGDE